MLERSEISSTRLASRDHQQQDLEGYECHRGRGRRSHDVDGVVGDHRHMGADEATHGLVEAGRDFEQMLAKTLGPVGQADDLCGLAAVGEDARP